MINHYLEKAWVQYFCLAAVTALLVYYFGWVFDFGYKFDWTVLYVKDASYGIVLGDMLITGLGNTITISLISSAIALGLGILFGLGRLSQFKPINYFASAYVEFFRNTPLLIQLFFWYFALPMALPEELRYKLFDYNYEMISATVGLGVYTSAFMAEVIRAGIQSIPKGLLEAAYSSGLTPFQALSKIVLPLAFRAIIPPLGSEFLNNMKNSSLAMVVGVAELCWASQQIESLTFKGFEATTAATVVYLSLSLTIAGILNLVNLKLQIIPKKNRTIGHLLADIFFWPFLAPLALLSMLSRNCFRRRTEGFNLTTAQAARKALLANIAKVFSLAWKGTFLAFLLFLIVMAGVGLSKFNFQVIWDNIGTMIYWRFPQGGPDEVLWGLGGLSFSIIMSVIAISVSFFIGLIVGVGRTSKNKLFFIPSTLYIELIRGNPLIMVIFWIYFFIPILTGAFLNVFWSATIALTVFTGAYLAEIVRSGIQNIPPGQLEAAVSTGLTYLQAMRKIILPQALKQMLPAIVGQFIAIFKDSSLAFVIGVLELTFVAQGLNNRLMIYPFEIYTTVAALYFICCYMMSIVARRLERKLSTDTFRLQM
ncbi:amino acid ABC transporter permease [Maridesulfovibrio frigidus]|uniref:amino acid ABC transporter permease n=1 Tax=Maridesulfovibrio frigidus TaxID=340956 RepID=UPI0004E13193|nr:amino acid ABC transporter permease [Maridesulfovibrio frigidus]